MNHHQQDQPQRIHDQVPFPPWRLLVHVDSAFFAAFRGLRTLAINYRCTGLRIPSGFLPHLFHQRFIDCDPQSIPFPSPIISIHRLPRRKIHWHHTPLASRAIHIQDRIQNLPHFPFARSTPLIARKEFHNRLPFGILEIGRVSLSEFSHSPILSDHLRNTLLGFLRSLRHIIKKTLRYIA